jgi:hypothetical protein
MPEQVPRQNQQIIVLLDKNATMPVFTARGRPDHFREFRKLEIGGIVTSVGRAPVRPCVSDGPHDRRRVLRVGLQGRHDTPAGHRAGRPEWSR